MNKLIVREFDPYVLDHATLISSDREDNFFQVYDLNNGNIMKVVRPYNEVNQALDGRSDREIIMYCYELIMDELFDKLKRSEEKKLPNHVLPKEIQLEHNRVKSYIVSKIPPKKYVSMADYFRSIRLDEFAHAIITLSKEVQETNMQGVYMPDLGNLSNVFYNPQNCNSKFIDYDGMQVDEFKTNCESGLIRPNEVSIMDLESFFDSTTGLFKPNIDILSLYSIFLTYTTNARLMGFKPSDYYIENNKVHLLESALREYIKTIGLNGTEFEGALYELFFGQHPEYPHKHIKQLLRETELVPYGKIRRFERI